MIGRKSGSLEGGYILDRINKDDRNALAMRVASLERQVEAQDREIREAVALIHRISNRVAYLEGLREAEVTIRQRSQV